MPSSALRRRSVSKERTVVQRIKIGRGLVEHEDGRLQGKHGSQRQALFLAAGEAFDPGTWAVLQPTSARADAMRSASQRAGRPILQAEGDLLIYTRHHHLRLGILKHLAHQCSRWECDESLRRTAPQVCGRGCCRDERIRRTVDGPPPDEHIPRHLPLDQVRNQAGEAEGERALAAAAGAEDERRLAGGTLKLTSRRIQRSPSA